MPAKKTTRKSTSAAGSRTSPPKKRAKKAAPRKTTSKSGPPRKRAVKKRVARKNKGRVNKGIAAFFSKIFQWIKACLVFIFIKPFRVIHKKTETWPAVAKWFARIFLPPAVIGIFLFLSLWIFYELRAAPIYDKAKVAKMPTRTVIEDRNGEVLGYMHGDNRLMVTTKNVSNYFIKALVAREDARFYDHGGVDLRGLGRSVYVLATGGGRQGGSTISMQLAENTFSYNGKSIDGKLLEMVLARKIESDFTKDQILEMYMNRIFWGGSIRGIESASMTYFEKHASELTLSESAMLAGIISGPNAFSPFRHLKKAILKRDLTLRSMVQYEFITQEQADEAMKEKIHIRPPERRMNKRSYVMAALKNELDVILEEHNIRMGGLKVTTTLDKKLQKSAEQHLRNHLRSIERKSDYLRRHQTLSQYARLPRKNRPDPQYVQGALVCLENNTGGIVAIVGGRDAAHSQFDRATYSKRQIGSIFKPFVYLAAFEKGLDPNQWVSDERIYPNEIKLADPNWHPKNSDGIYKPSIKISTALANSRNTSTIRIGDYAGLDNVIETARVAGFKTEIKNNPSVYLGAFGATPKEVATAYTAFPNNGLVYRPYLIEKITDAEGKVVFEGSGQIWWNNEVASAQTTAVSKILQQALVSGTGRGVRRTYGYRKPAGGKTGTTNDSRDGWFAGYNSKLTCAVWVGMDDNSTVYRGADGASLALPIWAKFMKSADAKFPGGTLSKKAIIVDPDSGFRSPSNRAIIVDP